MNARSWKAIGLVKPIWTRIDVERGRREELARRTGFAANDLSALNTGGLNMTEAKAQKIIDAVPELGITMLDLRPAEPALSERERQRIDLRLEELADLLGRGFAALGVTPDQLRPPEEARSRRAGQ